MKIYIQNLLLILIISIAFTGCYTVIWMPNGNNQTTNDQNYQEDSYYPANYYGEDYNHFYEYPWWYSLTPSTAYAPQNSFNRDTSQAKLIRQRDAGRGDLGWRGETPSLPTRNEPTIPTVSTNQTTTNGSQNTSSNSNGNRVESTSTKTSNSRDNSSNNNRTVRENNGDRKSNGRN